MQGDVSQTPNFTQPTKNINAFTAVLATSLPRKLFQKINNILTNRIVIGAAF